MVMMRAVRQNWPPRFSGGSIARGWTPFARCILRSLPSTTATTISFCRWDPQHGHFRVMKVKEWAESGDQVKSLVATDHRASNNALVQGRQLAGMRAGEQEEITVRYLTGVEQAIRIHFFSF